MVKQDILNTILDVGIIPIVRTDNATNALKAIEAVYDAGIPVLEVTMTVPGALRTLETARDRFGNRLVLGAGTVLDSATARSCILAGAEFCVSPTLDLGTIEMCNRYSKCVVPGALTPTEILRAWDAGASLVKVFPSGAMGGPRYIKALKAPLPHILLVPTGGVNLQNAGDFVRAGASAIAIGSGLVNQAWLDKGDFARIETVARKLRESVARARAT